MMIPDKKLLSFPNRLVFVGFGCVGQGVLPLILRHIGIAPAQITIVTAHDRGQAEAREYGIKFVLNPLTRENFRSVLGGLLGPGDFLLNLSVDVSSIALMELCQEKGALYLDSCIEPWAGGYTDSSLTASQRSNYAMRETVVALRQRFGGGPTMIPTHGANPGLVSHWVKQALVNIARDTGIDTPTPKTREAWAELSRRLGIKTIHCAERDTQLAHPPKRVGEFCNTWSVEAFVGEGSQPAELGWGTHEKHFPADGRRHDFGCQAAIYLQRPGVTTRVRTWTPLEGPMHGYLVTHGESISIADYLTVRDGDHVLYRPTVHYAYHPCDAAVLSLHELNGKNLRLQDNRRELMHDIYDGHDELGALLAGHARGAYWYGSRLAVQEARKLAPYNNATSLQVAAGVLGAMAWAMRNPSAGILDPDELPYEQVLEVASPYLGTQAGAYTDWTPLEGRGVLFPEDLDLSDPWQFKNVRVM